MPQKTLFVAAALLGFLGVVLGAFGSHALKERLAPSMLAIFEVGVRYQMYHALAAVAAALAMGSFTNGFMLGSGWLFVVGTLVFSGSLYLLALTEIKTWGMVTPLGGLLLLGGWLSMLIGAWRS